MDVQNKNAFFNELYDSTHEKVLAYIIAKCGKTEDIADIFQETYTEIVNIICKRGTAYIKNQEAFVIKIAKCKVYQHYTIRQRLHKFTEACNFEECDPHIEMVEEISLDERIIQQSTIEVAFLYLAQKDELTKKIFYLHYYMDKSIKEIAELLSVKESNVKNRLYRTLKELRDFIL